MLLTTVAHVVAALQEGPAPEDVKAGPWGFAMFIFLCVAVALLGFSLVKQLRKAQAAKDAGVYGDEPVDRTRPPADGAAEDHLATDDAADDGAGSPGREDPPRG